MRLEEDLRREPEDRLRFETLLADLATRFVGLPADQVDGAIESAQRSIVETLGLDRSGLFQLNPSGKMELTHMWVRPAFQPYPAGIPILRTRLRAGAVKMRCGG